MLDSFQFSFFSVIFPTSRHKKDRNSAIVCAMGLCLVSSCSSRDSASDSIIFIVKWRTDFLRRQKVSCKISASPL